MVQQANRRNQLRRALVRWAVERTEHRWRPQSWRGVTVDFRSLSVLLCQLVFIHQNHRAGLLPELVSDKFTLKRLLNYYQEQSLSLESRQAFRDVCSLISTQFGGPAIQLEQCSDWVNWFADLLLDSHSLFTMIGELYDYCPDLTGRTHELLLDMFSSLETDKQTRRETGAHYSPEEIATKVVFSALSPHLISRPSLREDRHNLTNLLLCDPACGGGAMLLAFAQLYCEGFSIESRQQFLVESMVGVDKDPVAVMLTKMALWVWGTSPGRPFDASKLAIVRGDSLVSVGLSQVASFDWAIHSPDAPLSRAAEWLTDPNSLSACDESFVSVLGDALVGVFFAKSDDRARQRTRKRWFRWLRENNPRCVEQLPEELQSLARSTREQLAPVHWQLTNKQFDILVTNPPYLGGKRVSSVWGKPYSQWISEQYQTSKNVDLAAQFVQVCCRIAKPEATIGLITTDSIREGENRKAGLAKALKNGFVIRQAWPSQTWAGDALIAVAHIQLSRALPLAHGEPSLSDKHVSMINSRLLAAPEIEAAKLRVGREKRCLVGSFVRGKGFVLTREQRSALIKKDRRCDSYIKPFLGGDEINSIPNQAPYRFVICIDEAHEEEALKIDLLRSYLERKVKPFRTGLNNQGVDNAHKKYWWRFAQPRIELYRRLSKLSACIVTPRVSKHCVFAIQPTDRVFSDQLCVFPSDSMGLFALLHSRAHRVWVKTHSSTRGVGIRYTPSQCVDTFPFLQDTFFSHDSLLHKLGCELNSQRNEYLVSTQTSMTTLYNELAKHAGPKHIAHTHQRIDQAVIDAYGWLDLVLPAINADAAEQAQFDLLLLDRLRARCIC